MDDEPTVDCSVHGTQPLSFVCIHIASGLLDETTPGFVIEPEDDHPLPLAWCEECDRWFEKIGRDWSSQEWPAHTGFKLLCARCYGEAKGRAISSNRFHNRRPSKTPRR